MIVIRVYGSILYSTRRWGAENGEPVRSLEPEHIDAWMKNVAESGITTVLWRANCAGTLTYPSRFTALAGEPPLPDPNRGMGIAEVKQGWPAEDWDFLGKQCRHFNTLTTAVESAHRHGLKIYLDFHTFDMVGSWCTTAEWRPGSDRAWNPDGWLWSKDQKQRLAGVPCYADPLVRKRRVNEIAEALESGIDGVALGFFSHCDAMSGDAPCRFGYNPIIVEQYQQRHGVDPLAQEVDPHRFYALHGEHFTQFVREAAEVVRGKGKKLLCTTRTDGIHGWGGSSAANTLNGEMAARDLRDGKSEIPLAAAFYLEWEKWSEQKLVDGLLCAAPHKTGVEKAQQVKRASGLPVHLWRKYTGYKGRVNRPFTFDDFRQEVQSVRQGALDGYCMLVMQIVPHALNRPDWRDLLKG